MNETQSKAVRYRKLRYGSFAVALTVVCVALVILINAIFSALSQKFLWYLDMTEEQVYGLSDASRVLLDEYAGVPDFEVKIIFCMPQDQIQKEYYKNMVYMCARQFAEEYDFVTIEFLDIITYPHSVDPYMTTAMTKINQDSVILTNGSTSRVLDVTNFFTFDSASGNVFAFNGEYKLTSAIVQMDGDNPIAYFVEGHGESNKGSTMYTLFEEAGFDVRTIDLTHENIDPNARVLVLNNPVYDLMGANGAVNEIAKIDHFLDDYGNLMVFRDAGDRQLPELDELLSEWGIKFENAVLRDYSHSLSVDGTELVAEYATAGAGASISERIRSLDVPPKTIVNYACPITLTFESRNSRQTSAVLTTSSEKTARAFYNGTDDTEGIPDLYTLMAVSVEIRYVDNNPITNYVLAAGTAAFSDDDYISSNFYANRDIIFTTMKTFGKRTVPMDIDFKMFEDEGLDITSAEANRYTVLDVAVLPLIVFVVALVVYIRRRGL